MADLFSPSNTPTEQRQLADAARLAAFFAAIKLVIHIAANLWQAHIGWGYFREELYFLICGRYLAWGYVDQGPLVALQAKLTLALFGKSLAGIRMLSSLAGAGRVFLTGILAWSLGGRRPAQGLAMTGVLLATTYFTMDSYLSMNSFESLFWIGALLPLILILRGGSEKLWLLFGLSAGLGMLNKPSIGFFLFCLLLALLITPQRRILASRWMLAGVALLLLIEAPALLWQAHHHWPTVEFLLKSQATHDLRQPILQFLAIQVLDEQPFSFVIWGAGLLWLLLNDSAAKWSWLGWTYVLLLVLFLAFDGKNYYLAPIYPVLFAAGGCAWEQHFRNSQRVLRNSAFAFPAMQLLLLLYAVVVLPLSLPILRPQTWEKYVGRTHLNRLLSRPKNLTNTLPAFYADRFGWQEEVDMISGAYHSLSPEDQKKVAIFCTNYGEASAVNFLGKDLPFAISGNENYFLWGPHGATGEVVILIHTASPEALLTVWSSVQLIGELNNPWSETYEHRKIYLVRGRHGSLVDAWPRYKRY